MDIVNKRLDMIKPYGKNPRKNDEAVKYVAESIKQFGFKVPIIIDCDGVIVAGHTRYKAAKKLKMETVPCIVADDLTDEQIKAFRLADNKVAEKAAAEKAAASKWALSERERKIVKGLAVVSDENAEITETIV